jgi:DNA topoisomerase-6 subunit A
MIPQGKGNPDLDTRGLCSRLASDPGLIQRRVPMYILTDPDPYGYLIASLFKNGSQRMNFYPKLCAPNAVRIGVTPLDLTELSFAGQWLY